MKPRLFSSVKVRSIVYLLALVGLLFYCLTLVGCISSSPGIPGLFLVAIQDVGINSTSVQIGYFGMCSRNEGRNATVQILCSSTIGTAARDLSTILLVPESMAQYGLDVRRAVFPPFLAAGGMSLLLGVLSFLLLKMTLRTQHSDRDNAKKANAVKQVPRLLQVTQAFIGLSIVIAFTVAYATTVVLSGLSFVSSPGPAIGMHAQRGGAVEILQWAIVGVLILFGLGANQTLQLNKPGPLPKA